MEPECHETTSLHLFEGYGIELEYMIVDKESADVLPICDKLLEACEGRIVNEVTSGPISYSNELALHVVELKTTDPMHSLEGVSELFQEHVGFINRKLAAFNAHLCPTATHPWMDPDREMRLWEHEYNPIYESYHRIFNCRGHGWANLQSTHINLPFCGDGEFAKLHQAIRLLLPIMPALAASSPIIDAKMTGYLDGRLSVYQANQKLIPSITAHVIPESVYSRDSYQKNILDPMYRDIAPYDPEGILQYEWLNSRGAIARFDRDAIEIRVLDIQECPQADLAICQAIVETLKILVAAGVPDFPLERLTAIYRACIQHAEEAIISDREYLTLFGQTRSMSAKELWWAICSHFEPNPYLIHILERGSLATRILKACGSNPQKPILEQIYKQLATCLSNGTSF